MEDDSAGLKVPEIESIESFGRVMDHSAVLQVLGVLEDGMIRPSEGPLGRASVFGNLETKDDSAE